MTCRKVAAVLAAVALIVPSCAGVPSSSSPQAIGTVQRPAPPGMPAPTPGMEPETVLREFLKATADPSNRHRAARQFLTESGSRTWDDAGAAVLIESPVFADQRGVDRWTINVRANKWGTLSDIGVFETAQGDVQDPQFTLVKANGEWRIDSLPNGVLLDWGQFQSTYRRYTVYFADPAGRTVVPDPRYVAVNDPDLLATELVYKLLSGPRPELAGAVRNHLNGLRLRGPVTRVDGSRVDVGRGYGGVRVELEGDLTPDQRTRQFLAAQVIWTLSRAGIAGPYVLQVNGAPLDEQFAQGWSTQNVASTDPGASEGAGVGLYGLLNGSMVTVDRDAAVPVRGSFGQVGNQVSAALSRSGRQVASVVRVQAGDDPQMSLWVGANGANGSEAVGGKTLTRPSWALDDAVWTVIDGGRVVRIIQEATTSMVAVLPVEPSAVAEKYKGPITELALSRDGTRAAMIIEGQVILATVVQTESGDYALTHPRRLGYGLGNSAVSLAWRTGDDIAVARNDGSHPVANVNLDGVNSDLNDQNLLTPVSTVAASPAAIYIADARGVLQLTGLGTPEERWVEVRPLMVPQAIPVLTG
ncbi:MtrAB system accessory lipoprotein LpqB [Mycobacteroides abscessus]|nr:MtrAB system accessory lipoprotein LpqB [Mycobacteroides abscessus]MDM2323659.1 MtrAB system accessory lipoprotein LpqB [Mycobacteroides abscessus]MDM2327609.1 MtrAB system accessory lipoprotein LpqB [Mycobacteroides abscessus]MDM2333300.1 MtrAB system accessory lipoprotein LpqB [Mycobacteroides abscessus]MDM2339175.1 MtrAB system accessory lipoprotein LpqB [Mycobacteroides abscessus]